jgi:hypothetical protein
MPARCSQVIMVAAVCLLAPAQLVAASSDLETGAPLALLGITAVTIMAARDIGTAPAAARRYNARTLGLTLGLDPARGEGRLGLRLGVAVNL